MKYKSCHLLEHGLCFYNHNLCSCCYAPQDSYTRAPYLSFLYLGQKIKKEQLFNKINKRREEQKKGNFIISCNNCFKLEEKDWDEDNYIDQIYITHFEQCNLNCIYCITDLSPKERAKETYKIIPVLDNLKEQGILRQGCEFHIGGGEFSIYPECDEIIEKYILSGFSKFLAIATNAVVYKESVFNAMDKGKACIIVSVDSGSKNMYKKIKRVDAFDKLIENLKLYSRTESSRANTFLKYIVIPKINDNKREFDKFLNLANKLNIKGIKIDVDGNYARNNLYKLNDKINNFLTWTVDRAKSKGFDVEIFSFYKQCLNSI